MKVAISGLAQTTLAALLGAACFGSCLATSLGITLKVCVTL